MSQEGASDGDGVRVTRSDGRVVVLPPGRSAEIAEWLTDHAAEVDAVDYASLQFDCAPGITKPRFQKMYPPIKGKPAL